MASPIEYLNVVRYFRDARPWTTETTAKPTWNQVEAAIRQMDNYCFPIVQLGCRDPDDDNDSFNVVGGDGRLSLFHFMAEWLYDDSSGNRSEVRLWESDQGYFCCECNVISDLDLALRITKKYFETGSYDELDAVI
ncbi:hypothetical protein LOC67_26945 [Stieleria sp. JC731]|uniref:hypothetical protein n=1 Tax=Stieleria sp. JC731 TaxID=2894195 RepID=UPI001E4C1C37|nr:hypothetical protein [Stieleria sp. JC731]MCC9604208.1 hypothetical protein [Stieleria sp. JC731]